MGRLGRGNSGDKSAGRCCGSYLCCGRSEGLGSGNELVYSRGSRSLVLSRSRSRSRARREVLLLVSPAVLNAEPLSLLSASPPTPPPPMGRVRLLKRRLVAREGGACGSRCAAVRDEEEINEGVACVGVTPSNGLDPFLYVGVRDSVLPLLWRLLFALSTCRLERLASILLMTRELARVRSLSSFCSRAIVDAVGVAFRVGDEFAEWYVEPSVAGAPGPVSLLLGREIEDGKS